jgi:tripartite-type tricarboxylate transporter receptor subunit TctC
MSKMLSLIAAAAAAVVVLAAAPAAAQSAADYPNKPIRILVSVPPGGGVDTVTRLVTARMGAQLGQTFVVENRGGAGGNLAADQVYKSEPDGYQLLASQPAPLTTNATLYKSLSFDPTKFEYVGIMSVIPNVLLVKNDFPAKTAKEFMDYVKANPGKVNYASQGPGTTSHLTAELYSKLTGAKMTHVPYKGTGPALNDIVAGHVDFIFMQLESAIKLHQGGKARILAVTTAKRIPQLPDAPTMEELGLKGLISDTWNAISAPPGTPAPIVTKLNATLNDVLKEPELAARFKQLLLTPGSGNVAETRAFIAEDTKRWSEVIKEANIPRI